MNSEAVSHGVGNERVGLKCARVRPSWDLGTRNPTGLTADNWHLHLMALQRAVLLAVGQPETLAATVWRDSTYFGPDCARAWQIVNVERHECYRQWNATRAAAITCLIGTPAACAAFRQSSNSG